MSLCLPVEWHGGHLLVRPLPGLAPWLIDTGAPHSASHRPGDGYLGATLADIERMVGCELDRLIGLDVLGAQPVLLTRKFVEFGAPRPASGHRVGCGGRAPYLPVQLADGTTRLCLFDSGAPISYALPRLVADCAQTGRASDFFPSFGQWETPLHNLSVRIAGRAVTLKPGVLPHGLRMMTSEVAPLILGSELLRSFDVWLDRQGGKIVVVAS